MKTTDFRTNKYLKDSRTFRAPIDFSVEENVFRTRTSVGLKRLGVSYRVIDLFSGAGGMTVGFSSLAGNVFESVWANDFNEAAVASYNANFGNHCKVGNIVDLLEEPGLHIPKADVVIGGPPCQGFSLLNKNRFNDPRKQLWRPYMEVVRRSGATVFVMENVIQLLGSIEHEMIIEEAKKLGFSVASEKLCAADYGAPQTRWRAIIIGFKGTDPARMFPPKRTNYNPVDLKKRGALELEKYISNPEPWKTVRDSIADLKVPKGIEIRNEGGPYNLHFGRTPTTLSQMRYRAIPKEGMNRFDLQERAPKLTPKCWIRKKTGGTDLFGRLWWDRPSVTIRTEFYKPEKGRYLHPVQNRPITHREAARFQTFPDEFIFKGNKIEVAKQIGNAVPPLLAARLADCVFSLLYSKKNGGHI